MKVQLVDIDSLVPGQDIMRMMTMMTMKMTKTMLTKMMLVTMTKTNMLHIPG